MDLTRTSGEKIGIEIHYISRDSPCKDVGGQCPLRLSPEINRQVLWFDFHCPVRDRILVENKDKQTYSRAVGTQCPGVLLRHSRDACCLGASFSTNILSLKEHEFSCRVIPGESLSGQILTTHSFLLYDENQV